MDPRPSTPTTKRSICERQLAQLAGQKMPGLLILLNQIVNAFRVAPDGGPQQGRRGGWPFSSRGSCEYFAESGIEQAERSIQFGFGDRQWRKQPNDFSGGAIDEHALSDGGFVHGARRHPSDRR